MVTKRCLQWIVVAWVLSGAASLWAQSYALPDAEFTVDPTFAVFGVTPFGSQSAARVFTVTNRGESDLVLYGATLAGAHPDQFFIAADGCSNQTLEAETSCTMQVAFKPSRRGTKAALLQISSGDPETPVLSAFLTNQEDTAGEAQRRMPPVLQSLELPATMQAGVPCTINWSLLGYDDGYTSNIVFFDCTAGLAGCGAAYTDSSRFAESGNLLADTVEDGDWSYRGFVARRFNYSYTFTPPTGRFIAATDVVVRFYNKCGQDADALLPSLSLLLPGNLAGMAYHDCEGRRLQIEITP